MGFLTDFQLKQYDAERNKGDPIIIEIQGERERRAGGKHATTLGNLISVVRGVAPQSRGSRNMTPSEDGVRFKGVREFQVIKSDLTVLGITEQDTKNMRVFNGGMMFRVMSQSWPQRERIVRLFTERERGDYPTLEGTWDFEDDTVGDEPANCTVTKPAGTTAAVAVDGTNVVAMTSAVAAAPQIAINVLDVCEGPASSIEFDIKITGGGNSIISRIVLGEIDDIADLGANVLLYMVIEKIAGVLHLKDITGLVFDTTITDSSWVHVIVSVSRGRILTVTVDGVVLVDDVDVSAVGAMAEFVLFTGYANSGATVKIDNVEVDCVAR